MTIAASGRFPAGGLLAEAGAAPDPVARRSAFASPPYRKASAWGMRTSVDMLTTASDAEAARRHLAQSLRRVARREPGSLKSVYDRTCAKLYGICLRLLDDEEEARDVLQEIYLAVWRNAARFDERRASPITWLCTIARNRAIDRLRARREPVTGIEAASGVADDAPSSFEVLEQAEDASRLVQCIERLDERAREMIRSAFFSGYSYPELAGRAGEPLPTIKSRIRRGLQRLRECMET